jgi:hypothetical protein
VGWRCHEPILDEEARKGNKEAVFDVGSFPAIAPVQLKAALVVARERIDRERLSKEYSA